MKEKYLKITETFKLKKSTKEMIKQQIELFYAYNNNHNKKYEINEFVILNEDNLIHGSRADLETLETISKTGLIALYSSKESSSREIPLAIQVSTS